MAEVYNEIASLVLKVIISLFGIAFTAIVIPWLKNVAIPWLKEKRVYTLCQKFVRAAEKLADAGTIQKSNKHEYVVSLLEGKGIEITPEVAAFIESTVGALDDEMRKGIGLIVNEFTDDQPNDDEIHE